MTDTTNTDRDTFELLAYGLFSNVPDLENAMPSPMEKALCFPKSSYFHKNVSKFFKYDK